MKLARRGMIIGAGALAIGHRARMQAVPTIRIGMLQDASGPYSILGGRLSLECARQTILEVPESTGFKIELISANHFNKPDTGMSIARQWISEGVDAIPNGTFTNGAQRSGLAAAVGR
jgi:branched-chain amino acid transport system substrate-binding protein